MVQSIFFELSIVVLIATFISILIKLMKQPLIIGYIITGIIVGPFFLNLVQSSDFLAALSEIGIAFLLFIVGLSLNLKTIKEVGFVSLTVGFTQVIFTALIGYFLGRYLGFTSLESLYISVTLTFSSTIIVIKLMSDKKALDSLIGKITTGILLVQDLIVIFILMLLYGQKTESLFLLYSTALLKSAFLVILLIIIGHYFMPRMLHFMAKSQELLFLFSIGWVLIIATLLYKLGFSREIGALFAGISLASSPYHYEISSKIKSLRDFFIILFFVLLGSKIVLEVKNILALAIIFSLFVFLVKPLIIILIMGLMKYHRKIGFSIGLSLAQISEFSLILVLIGQSVGHISQGIVSLVTLIGLITIAGSTYLVQYNNKLYQFFSDFLRIFERKKLKSEFAGKIGSYKIVLFGYNRVGYTLLKSFKKIKKSFLVVDINPEVIKLLKEENAPYKYGDAGDIELLNELALEKIEMVISTIPDIDTNLFTINKVRSVNKNAVVIITSHQIDEAFALYEAGADYVILPHFLGGEHASTLIEKFGTKINKFISEKYKHIEELKRRKHIGHEHPRIH